MDIQVPRIDGRTRIGDIPHPIIDGDSGKKVGFLECRQGMTTHNRRYHSRSISLFDNKIRASFETHAECVAFAKGIEAAINQIIAPKDQPKDHPSIKGYYEFTVVQPTL
jgi:hypothetical protein